MAVRALRARWVLGEDPVDLLCADTLAVRREQLTYTTWLSHIT